MLQSLFLEVRLHRLRINDEIRPEISMNFTQYLLDHATHWNSNGVEPPFCNPLQIVLCDPTIPMKVEERDGVSSTLRDVEVALCGWGSVLERGFCDPPLEHKPGSWDRSQYETWPKELSDLG